MSQSEGPATGGAGAPARPSAARAPAPPRSWEDTFPALPPHQQLSLLDLAARQGYLLADQLPEVPAPPADPVRSVLQEAFADRLPPVPLADPVDCHDAALDPTQRDAVARALTTPDLFVLQGPTGTGKTRVALEIVRQAVRRGGRVLLLSPTPAALDSVLPKLDDVLVVRRLGPGEAADRLPPALAALVPGRREATIRADLVRRSGEALAEAEERARKADRLQSTWQKWTAVRDRLAAHTAERERVAAERQALPDAIRRETDSSGESAPFNIQRLRGVVAAHARRRAAHDATAAEIATARTDAEARRQAAEGVVRDLKPKADALDAGRWYSPAYWRARLDSTVATRLAATQADLAAAAAALEEIAVREQKLALDRQLADEEHEAERVRFLEAEVARRQADLDERLAALDREAAADATREAELAHPLREAGIDSTDATLLAAEVNAARRELAFARGWAEQVRTSVDQLVRDACGPVQVVAGPVAGIGNDSTIATAPFDLLVIDDAHRLAEADFQAAARLARRWVLVGAPVEVPAGRQRAAKPDLFARLTAALRHHIWTHDGPRLVCRLYPVRGADRRRLECEPVADAPDIELRLFTPPGGDPTLAEVAFPGTTTPAVAREYLVRELSEVTCEPHGRTATWHETPAGPVLRFAPADPAAALAEIGPGVREELAGLETRALHFAADWSLDRARAWAAENVGRRAGGRLAALARAHRACPGLALWLNRAFDTGFAIVPAADEAVHVEFLAVPDHEPRRRHGHSRPPGRVGGAGYEIDLADPRQRATLAPDLADLPAAGIVNLPEAQALVRYLEPLAGSGLAVTSPFPAQVAVLRKLLARSSRLAQVPVLEVTDAARHECDLLAVSLTRSHVARAVPFGEGPHVLAALLGRARKRILFAGDPGTLARRLQWEGPVDHLDAADAARERAWVAALADCPRVTGPRPRHAPPESVRA